MKGTEVIGNNKEVKPGIVITFESITEAFMKLYIRSRSCDVSKFRSRNLIKVWRSKHSRQTLLVLSTFKTVLSASDPECEPSSASAFDALCKDSRGLSAVHIFGFTSQDICDRLGDLIQVS